VCMNCARRAGTNALPIEADIAKVQESLGHANVSATVSITGGGPSQKIIRRFM